MMRDARVPAGRHAEFWFTPNHARRARYRRQNGTVALTPAQERRIRAKAHRDTEAGIDAATGH